ncbi:hypothetical protein MPSEU_000045600 [Mayamaea pseudoterrestris]|nr:hypothetical protein MPSEU_000045600 [Mayamaea pseudoterrestris]
MRADKLDHYKRRQHDIELKDIHSLKKLQHTVRFDLKEEKQCYSNDTFSSALKRPRSVSFSETVRLIPCYHESPRHACSRSPRNHFASNSPVGTSATPFWYSDHGLQRSKIYAGKLNKAATLMTALARGHFGRNVVQKLRIERHRNRLLDRRWQRQQLSATRIQRVVRNYMNHDNCKIRHLQTCMRNVQLAKEQELGRIQQWKDDMMRQIQAQVNDELVAVCQVKACARINLDATEELRDENVQLREERNQLQQDVWVAKHHAANVQQEIEEHQRASTMLRRTLIQNAHESTKWRYICHHYEKHFNDLTTLINGRIARGRLEHSLQHLYRKTVRRMIYTIASRDHMRTTVNRVLKLVAANTVSDRLSVYAWTRDSDELALGANEVAI